MKFKIKLVMVLIISILQSVCLTGCWNSREIDSLAFVTAIGFDKIDGATLITFQILNPRAVASQKPENEPPVVVFKQKGQDTIDMIRKTVTQSSRKLNSTHLQTVIFSEEFAKDGISEVLDYFSREHQIRTDVYFAVAEGCTANQVLNTLTPLDNIPSVRLYTSMKNADQIWAGTSAVKIIGLINSIISEGKNPVITGVAIMGDCNKNQTIERLKETDGATMQIGNLAAFQKDKLVGWFNEDESKGFNYIIGNVKSTIGYVEDKNIGKMTTEITGTKTKQTVTLVNGSPVITVNIEVKANIETSSNRLDITKAENIHKIETLSANKIKEFCNESITQAQKELKSDVFGFGELIHRSYPKLWHTMKDNWNDQFTELPIKVNVTFKIEKIGTISKSYFMKDKK